MSVLLASAARDASGTASLGKNFSRMRSALLTLNVTAAATDAGDTLDVYLQHSVDGGLTWDDFAHFTQVLGNGGAKKFIASWNGDSAPETEMHAQQDAALAAGAVVQGPVGDDWRLKWVIVDAGADNASFTFGVTGAFVTRARR